MPSAVDQIMTKEVVTLHPQMTLREALEVLQDAGASGAPVTAGERVVGVASRSDLLEFQADNPGVPIQREDRREWGEWGSADLWEEDAEEVPSQYFAEFWENAGADVYERFRESEGPEWDLLAEHTVSEVMTRQIVALPPDADVRDASRLMGDRGIHRILVVDDGRLVGIVTSMDVVRAVADGRIG